MCNTSTTQFFCRSDESWGCLRRLVLLIVFFAWWSIDPLFFCLSYIYQVRKKQKFRLRYVCGWAGMHTDARGLFCVLLCYDGVKF